MARQPKPPTPNQKKSPRNSHTSARAIKYQKKIEEALEYRRMGHSYPKIAEAMGISLGGAHALVVEGMKQIVREPAEAVKEMELARLDEMLTGIYQIAVGGDPVALNNALNIMGRRARYLGLDMPIKTAETDPAGNAVSGPRFPAITFVFSDDKGGLEAQPSQSQPSQELSQSQPILSQSKAEPNK